MNDPKESGVWGRALALVIAYLVCGVAFAALIAGAWTPPNDWRHQAIQSHYATIIGVPASAGAAFVLVTIFREIVKGETTIKLWRLELSGPTGPLLLWVACFLAIIFAIWLTWNLRP